MLTQVRSFNPSARLASRRKGLEGFDCTKMSSAAYEERDGHRGLRSHPVRRRGIAQRPPRVLFRGSSVALMYSSPSGPIAVTCVTYSLDFAQWKWDVLPGRTMTLPGGNASSLSGLN